MDVGKHVKRELGRKGNIDQSKKKYGIGPNTSLNIESSIVIIFITSTICPLNHGNLTLNPCPSPKSSGQKYLLNFSFRKSNSQAAIN